MTLRDILHKIKHAKDLLCRELGRMPFYSEFQKSIEFLDFSMLQVVFEKQRSHLLQQFQKEAVQKEKMQATLRKQKDKIDKFQDKRRKLASASSANADDLFSGEAIALDSAQSSSVNSKLQAIVQAQA